MRSVLLSSPAADTINIDVADAGHDQYHDDHDVGIRKGGNGAW